MLFAENPSLDRDRFRQQRLAVGKSSLIPVHRREIVHDRERVGVLLTKQPALHAKHVRIQLDAARDIAGPPNRQRQIGHRRQRFRMVFTVQLPPPGNRFRQNRDRPQHHALRGVVGAKCGHRGQCVWWIVPIIRRRTSSARSICACAGAYSPSP